MTIIQLFMLAYIVMTHVAIAVGNEWAARTFLFANVFLLSTETIRMIAGPA